MIFKYIQASMPIWIFDRNKIELKQGKITSATPSHLDIKIGGKMVVDFTATFDTPQSYTVEDSLTIAYFNNTAISLDREAILREIETMQSTSEQALQEVQHHQDIVAKCKQILVDNNPKLKEKKENEERFSNIESKLDKLSDLLENLLK